ncbi:MAG TPA: pyruvate kinase [Thermoanaerobaculia bacterium]|jgi:pyruvate kinase|nr:pyruvate kinase [Thermoanaerobaculia bacterium]
MRRTKIVCTIGPASRDPAVLAKLVEAGMDVARLNFSHGTHEEHARVIAALRALGSRARRPVAILQDLAGLKIRIGEIAPGHVRLEPGSAFTLTTRGVPGNATEASVSYPELARSVRPGDRLLLADGEIALQAEETTATDVRCRVIAGGLLSSHKGISLPGRTVEGPSLTDKDREDLAFGVAQGVDYAALSFVRCGDDVRMVRAYLAERGASVPLIAKIEKHEALGCVDEILDASDGIMVARGDLGVETPLEHVPLLQKMLIDRANRAGKPVITATQMLLSMVERPRPTRAEVADVANAILDGTDALMLSEETASGRFPVEAAETMRRIAEDTETAFPFEQWMRRFEDRALQSLPEAVAGAAAELAEHIGAGVIVAWTESGETPRLVAKHRPRRPILALSTRPETARRLALVWGVEPLVVEEEPDTDAMLLRAPALAVAHGLLRPGETAVITAGIPIGVAGSTNLIKAAVAQP